MSRLYSRLAQLQKELLKARTEEDRQAIEDEIAELEDELELKENSKYDNIDEEF